MRRRLQHLLDPLLVSGPGDALVTALFRLWVSATTRREPRAALRRLYRADDLLQGRIDLLAIELEGGVHPKHRIMRYHDFFVERVRAGERVLDVGCGKGELAFDLAERARANVTGIDVNARSLAFARARFPYERVELVEADAREWSPPASYDVVVLSNVLEHVSDRVALLRRLAELARPSRFLIRVPVLERDWQVIMRRELGLPYFGDPTHETEYDEAQLEQELAAAGLAITELTRRWGEIWAVAETAGGRAYHGAR
jgi:2-polyprenyl-3-methyl-5-hydroxy-6-metoxy-1,4-benzoquinol methylase